MCTEIDARRQFLREMGNLGLSRKYESEVMGQVAQKVREMDVALKE